MSSGIDLECTICLCNFDDPRILNCGHTFCKSCISQLLDSKPKKKLSCPECRCTTDASKGVDQLPTNWALKKAVESSKSVSVASNSSQPRSTPMCHEHRIAAIMYCQRCVKLLCSKCLQAHSTHLDDVCNIDDEDAIQRKIAGSLIAKIRTKCDELTQDYCWDKWKKHVSSARDRELSVIARFEAAEQSLRERIAEMRATTEANYQTLTARVDSRREALSDCFGISTNILRACDSAKLDTQTAELDWNILAKLASVASDVVDLECLSTVREVQTENMPRSEPIDKAIAYFGKLIAAVPPLLTTAGEFEVTFKNPKIQISNHSELSRFSVGNLELNLALFAHGPTEVPTHLGLVLFLYPPPTISFEVRFKLTLVNQLDSRLNISHETNHEVTGRVERKGWNRFCPIGHVLDTTKGYFHNHTIKVLVDLAIITSWNQERQE